ncbi:MAG: hypothetical protein JO248_19570 [Acidimicrobiia bacterium]|nr:hypothetical protein [Acidimicrobiia bacterium]
MQDRDLDTTVGGSGLDALYRAHYESMVRLAGLLTGDFSIGEEIAQDAFARLVDARGVREPSAYLRATVVNLSRSRIRRAVIARRHGAAQAVSSVDPASGPEGVRLRSRCGTSSPGCRGASARRSCSATTRA